MIRDVKTKGQGIKEGRHNSRQQEESEKTKREHGELKRERADDGKSIHARVNVK